MSIFPIILFAFLDHIFGRISLDDCFRSYVLFLIKFVRAGDTGGELGAGGRRAPPPFLRSKKKKGRQRGKRKGFKAETTKRLSPRSKYYSFNHSRASGIRKFFLSANHGWPTILFSVSWPFHFEIRLAGPVVEVSISVSYNLSQLFVSLVRGVNTLS